MRKFEIAKGFENLGINLPVRGTTKSAGYDFEAYLPNGESVLLEPNTQIVIHTGVKVLLNDDEVLKIYPRSSVGIKKNAMLSNSVGVIDADYYGNPKNDGEIMICIYNYGVAPLVINNHDKLAQGIFQKYLITDDDVVETVRNGGIGSTGK